MTTAQASNLTAPADTISARSVELFKEQQQNIVRHTDQIFARLMGCQWVFGVLLALWISPRAWAGTESRIGSRHGDEER